MSYTLQVILWWTKFGEEFLMDEINTFVTLFSTFEFFKKKFQLFFSIPNQMEILLFFILGFTSKLPLVLENNLCHIIIWTWKKYTKISPKITSFKKRLRMILTMKKFPFTTFFIIMFITSIY
jgi:hypothetical protein